jgi:hypothetical protein
MALVLKSQQYNPNKQYGFYGKFGTKNTSSPTSGGPLTSTSMIQDYIKQLETDKDAQLKEIASVFGQAKSLYEPGGKLEKALEAKLSRGKFRDVAARSSVEAGKGFGSSTKVGGFGKKFEEEVGMPTRMSQEAQNAQALANLLGAEMGARSDIIGSTAGVVGQLTSQLADIYARPATGGYSSGGGGSMPKMSGIPSYAGGGGGGSDKPAVKSGLQPDGSYIDQHGNFYGAKTFRAQNAQKMAGVSIGSGSSTGSFATATRSTGTAAPAGSFAGSIGDTQFTYGPGGTLVKG